MKQTTLQSLPRPAFIFKGRPHRHIAVGMLLAVAMWASAFAPFSEDRTATAEPTVPPTWLQHTDAALQFAYPPTWSLVTTRGTEAEGAAVLDATDEPLHLRLTYTTLKTEARHDLRAVERRLVHSIEQDFERHFIRIRPAMRIGGHAMAAVEYTALGASGEEVKGLRIGRQTADKLLVFDVTAPTLADIRSTLYRTRAILETVTLSAPPQDAL